MPCLTITVSIKVGLRYHNLGRQKVIFLGFSNPKMHIIRMKLLGNVSVHDS